MKILKVQGFDAERYEEFRKEVCFVLDFVYMSISFLPISLHFLSLFLRSHS